MSLAETLHPPPSQVMKYNGYQSNRPGTAAAVRYSPRGLSTTGNNQEGLGHLSVNSDKVKRFRSEFPNLPGFSQFSALRPQSPKVSNIHKSHTNCMTLIDQTQKACNPPPPLRINRSISRMDT